MNTNFAYNTNSVLATSFNNEASDINYNFSAVPQRQDLDLHVDLNDKAQVLQLVTDLVDELKGIRAKDDLGVLTTAQVGKFLSADYIFAYMQESVDDGENPDFAIVREAYQAFKRGDCKVQEYIAQIVIDTLKARLNAIRKNRYMYQHIDGFVFFCIPASSQKANTDRFEKFSQMVCEATGLQNGFYHASVVVDTNGSVDGGDNLYSDNIQSYVKVDKDFFRNKVVFLFDDLQGLGNHFIAWHTFFKHMGVTVDFRFAMCNNIAPVYEGESTESVRRTPMRQALGATFTGSAYTKSNNHKSHHNSNNNNKSQRLLSTPKEFSTPLNNSPLDIDDDVDDILAFQARAAKQAKLSCHSSPHNNNSGTKLKKLRLKK